MIGVLTAACSRPLPEEEEELPEQAYQGPLTVWAAPGLAGYPGQKPDADWFEERARAFEAQAEGITVTLRLFETPVELEQALLEAGGPDRPDLVWGRFLPELRPDLADVRPLLDEPDLQDYLPNARAAFAGGFEPDGPLYGLPALLEVQVLALNKTVFEEAGVPLPESGDWSLSDFEGSLRRLSKSGHFALGFYQLPGYHEWWPFADGLLTPSGGLAPGAAQGLERLNRYRVEGWLYPDTGKVRAEEIWQQFAAGRFAMLPVGTWALPLLRQDPYNIDLTVAGFPEGQTVGYTYGFSFFKQQDPLKLKAAVKLAQFMAAPDQLVRLARETGLMPARKRAGNPFAGDELLARAYELAEDQRPLPAGPAWDAAKQEIAQELLYAIIGGKQPADALAAVEALLPEGTTPANP